MPQRARCSDNTVAAFLDQTCLSLRQKHKALTIWPILLRPEVRPADARKYVSLSDAIENGDLDIDEVGDEGSISKARIVNCGARPVLVIFGEEITGAKQNRVANASFLIAEHSELTIDVTCVEQGRWSRRCGEKFAASNRIISNAIRMKMSLKVQRAAAAGRGFEADQTEVWKEVNDRVRLSQAGSSTGAYAHYYASRQTEVDEMSATFRALPRQIGFVGALRGEVIGAELLGQPGVFRRVFESLLRGYVVDAIDADFVECREQSESANLSISSPEPFLEALNRAFWTSGPSLGIGDDLRAESTQVAGCALAHGGIVHLTAFPKGMAVNRFSVLDQDHQHDRWGDLI